MLFESAGNPLPDGKTDRLSSLLWALIAEAFKLSEEAHRKNGGRDIPASDSLCHYVRRRAAEALEDEDEQDLFTQMSEPWGAYVGESIWRQSLRFLWMEECCHGGS